MPQFVRFGRRLALPSSRQIRHELLAFIADEAARMKGLQKPEEATIPAAATTVYFAAPPPAGERNGLAALYSDSVASCSPRRRSHWPRR
jgi:hypothetical protein